MIEMLTMEEVCELLMVKPWKLREWRQLGNGPYYVKLFYGKYLYPTKDLKRWLTSRKYRHEAQEILKKEEEDLEILKKEIEKIEHARKVIRAQRRKLLLETEGLV